MYFDLFNMAHPHSLDGVPGYCLFFLCFLSQSLWSLHFFPQQSIIVVLPISENNPSKMTTK